MGTRRGVFRGKDALEISGYLRVSSDGEVKHTVAKPNLGPKDIAIKLRLEVPKSVFEKPQLEVNIAVSDTVGAPRDIPVDAQTAIVEAAEQATGLTLSVKVSE